MADSLVSEVKKICKIEGCNRPHNGKGYCAKHWLQQWRGNVPGNRTCKDLNEIIVQDDIAEILLYDINGQEKGRTIIDSIDVEKIKNYKWRVSNGRVAAHRKDGGNIFLHRLINNTPNGMDTDHINRNTFDNRRSNLRTATHIENMRNRIKRKGSSEFKGVTWDKNRGRWVTRIKYSEREKTIGYFIDETEAATAYDNAAKELFGEFAKTNF